MTGYGNKIPGLTKGQVRERLADESDPKAIKRLTAAREYLEGQSPADIEAKFGWHKQTVYSWLNRFEERDFDDALYDDERPGRPPKLTYEQFQRFAETVHQPPEEEGYDEPAWTTALVQHHLLAEFEVAYSRRHIQRLLDQAEVFWKKPRPEPSSADEEELEEYDEELKKSRET